MRPRAGLFAVLVSVFCGLLLSFVLHNPRSIPNIYSDITSFWSRGWISAGQIPYVREVFEYPPVSGLLTYFASRVGGDFQGFYNVFAAMTMIAGMVLAWSCWKVAKARGTQLRPLYFILPSFLIYGIYNFDIFHVMFVMLSLQALLSGRKSTSALALGLAVTTKLASAVLIPVFLIHMWNRRDSAYFIAVSVAVIGIFNAPFALTNFDTWFQTYVFIGGFGLEDAWYVWIFQNPSSWSYAKVFGFGLMGILLLRVYTMKVDLLTKSFLALTAYLLGTYIYAPQFNLLLIPLVAVLAVDHPSLYLWETFNALIILTWFLQANPTLPWTLPQDFSLLRAVMLVWLALSVLRAGGWSLSSLIPGRGQKTLDVPLSQS